MRLLDGLEGDEYDSPVLGVGGRRIVLRQIDGWGQELDEVLFSR